MKNKLYIILILTFFITLTSCNKKTNTLTLVLDGYNLSWNATNEQYYIYQEFISDTSNDVIVLTSSTPSYNFADFAKGKMTTLLKFKIIYKVKSSSLDYSNEVIFEYDGTKYAPSITSLRRENSTLIWNGVKYATDYTVSISYNEQTLEYVTSSTSFELRDYITEYGTYILSVRTNKNDIYQNDSDETILEFIYDETINFNILFSYDFKTCDISDFSGNVSDKYADNSLKFTSNGANIVTPTFSTNGAFSVTASLIGKGAGGTSTITFYGLDENNKVLETVTKELTIQNSAFTITADFTSSDIRKIKFEYTKKGTGNFGLISLVGTIDEEDDKLLSIDFTDYNELYYVGDNFDYKGMIILSYKTGKEESLSLNSDLSNLKVTDFTTDNFGTYTANLTYNGLTTSFTYQVIYDYDAYYEIIDNVDIKFLNSNNLYLTYINLNYNDSSINILLDQNDAFTNDDISVINELISNIDEITYLYSNSNQKYFNYKYLITDASYDLAPYISLYIDENGIVLEAFGYKYLSTFKNVTTINSNYDIINFNNYLNFNNLSTSAQEFILSYASFSNNYFTFAVEAYTANDLISLYDPTLCDLSLTITNDNFMFDSYTTTELSSMDEWSNATASQGLHHYTTENYLYRSSYYAGATDLMGESLLSYLHDLMIETHTNYVNYATARTTAILTDADPLQPGNIILIYSGLSTSGVWDNGITWNREHVWPKALSGGLYTSVSNSDTGAGADLHQLKPAASNINSSRGSKMYGAQTTETTFAPRDEVKGDVARILFYMAVHYNMDIVELNVAESISLLLDWNNQDNVDAFERIRNNAVQNIQGNYNPFIDNPWFATLIWG